MPLPRRGCDSLEARPFLNCAVVGLGEGALAKLGVLPFALAGVALRPFAPTSDDRENEEGGKRAREAGAGPREPVGDMEPELGAVDALLTSSVYDTDFLRDRVATLVDEEGLSRCCAICACTAKILIRSMEVRSSIQRASIPFIFLNTG